MSTSVSSSSNPIINEESIFGITFDMRKKFASQPVTLDGKPARIMGTRFKFAVVAEDHVGGRSFQWSWPAVKRVIDKGGAFSTYE